MPSAPTTEQHSTAPAASVAPLPRWVPWLIALVPIFPPLYLVAFGALGKLRELSRPVQYVLAFFAGTQLLAALFTPEPLLSLPLAAARTALILAMIAAGVYLRDSRALRPLLWGYLVVFATAWAFTLIAIGPEGIQTRLGHPYYFVVSLGLLAAIALWITVAWKGAPAWWRVPAGVFALATLIATGSRGPLLALAVGAVAAALAGNLRYLRTLALLGVVGIAALGIIPGLGGINPLERLVTGGLTGRDQVWQGALNAFQASPVGGQGPYQIGPYITFLFKDGCHLTPTLEQAGIGCPEALARFYGAWTTAHNVLLHSLAETGVIGTLGLLAALVLGGVAVVRSRDGLLLAIYFGFLAMSVVDVVTAVPSPHFSELFWTAVGVALVTTEVRRRSKTAV